MSCRRLSIHWNCARRPLSDAAVRDAVLAALRHTRRRLTELNVVFVNDSQLTSLHTAWLQDETRTDVITFDLSSGRERMGELYVSVPCAYRLARERGVSPARELALYVVHGVLHAQGYDHETDAEARRMEALETRLLARFRIADPYALVHTSGSATP